MTHHARSLTRRGFCASTLGPLACLGAANPEPGPWAGPARVRKAYLAVVKPSWPHPTIDVNAARGEIESRLSQVEGKHPGLIRFTGGEVLRNREDAAGWLKAAEGEDVDAFLIIPITSQTDGISDLIGRSGTPTLAFVRPYAAHVWASFTAVAQAGYKADVLASSDYDDLHIYARIFYAIHHLRHSRLLVVVPTGTLADAAEYSRHFGTTFKFLTYSDLKAAYDAVDPRLAGEGAEACAHGALRVVEPSRDEIGRAYRFYLGVKELLRQEKANGITIDCLGGINRGELPGYPCLAWSRLDDEGLYGVCQADLQCTMTQLMMTAFSGKPGYVFNPVFDTSRNEIIQSHCVAPTAMHGVGGARAPYILRSHLETHAGVSLQVLMPIGETMTVCKFADARRFMLSTAEAIGNVDSESGCRTQVRTRVKDAEKMLANFKSGVHRVSFYGDYVRPIRKMSRMMAFEVVEEM